MGQNQSLDLSEKEKKELSTGLLREWWITSTQAFVDTVGSDVALKHLKPHSIHCGKAGGIVFQKLTSIPSNCVPAAVHGTGVAMALMFNGTLGRGYMASDGSLIREINGCSTKGGCMEACISFCNHACSNALMEYAPLYEMELVKSFAFGDDTCHWLVSKKGEKPLVASREEFLTPLDYKQPFVPSDDLLDFLSHSYAGELWVITTKAFIDSVGSGKALERLCFYMRHSGMSIAIRLSNKMKAQERNIESIVYLVQLIQGLHQINGEGISEKEIVEGTVEECPFSSSPAEICHQYEAFFNGICEAIDPEYEFSYDHRMTQGDETCHWTIGKKSEPMKEKPKEEAPSDNPTKILAIRFAKGEITKEDLEERIDSLRKLGLIK